MSKFFDRNGDGAHTLANVTHAGEEIADATNAGFHKLNNAASDMMETLSTMTWDEDEDEASEDEEPTSLAQVDAAWSLKAYLKEKKAEMDASLSAMAASIKQAGADAHAAMDHNGNGTISLSDMKNNIVDSAKATKEAVSKTAADIEAKIDSDGDGSADMEGMKQAFHRSAENMKASLEAFGQSMSEFFDRNGDGKHTFANVKHAGGEIRDATIAGYQAIDDAATEMMT